MFQQILFLHSTLLAACVASMSSSPNSTCPPGMVPANASNQTAACECGRMWSSVHHTHTAMCRDGQLLVYLGYCMTYNRSRNSLTYGPCPFNINISELVVPQDLTELDRVMCHPQNRTGEMCGRCLEGHELLVSHTTCKVCRDTRYAWLRYMTVLIIPPTVLFMVIMIFKIELSKSPFNGFVYFTQFVHFMSNNDIKLRDLTITYEINGSFFSVCYKAVRVICSMLSLDFSYLYHHRVSYVCFKSPPMKNMHVMALKYLEAFYPLLLILVVYLCVVLYSRNCKPAVLVWRAVKYIATVLRLNKFVYHDPFKCITAAFVAFLILAHSKILFTSLNLLAPTKIQEIQGTTNLQTHYWALYMDPTVRYFDKEHIPFAVLAIVVLGVFVVVPILLLILVQCRPFAVICSKISGKCWLAINFFVENFQGWYKAGLDGSSRDYRLVSVVFPLLKCLLAVWVLMFSGMLYRGPRVMLVPATVLLFTGSFFSLFKPYKADVMNTYDSLILWLLSVIAFSLVSPDPPSLYFVLFLLYIPLIAAVLYMMYWFCIWIVSRARKLGCFQCMRNARCCCCLVNNMRYPPLLSRALHTVGQDDVVAHDRTEIGRN